MIIVSIAAYTIVGLAYVTAIDAAVRTSAKSVGCSVWLGRLVAFAVYPFLLVYTVFVKLGVG